MIVDDDGAANNIGTFCWATTPATTNYGKTDPNANALTGQTLPSLIPTRGGCRNVYNVLLCVAPRPLSLCAVGALNGKRGGSARGRCCIRPLLEELGRCRLTTSNTFTPDEVAGWLRARPGVSDVASVNRFGWQEGLVVMGSPRAPHRSSKSSPGLERAPSVTLAGTPVRAQSLVVLVMRP